MKHILSLRKAGKYFAQPLLGKFLEWFSTLDETAIDGDPILPTAGLWHTHNPLPNITTGLLKL